jgi:hypothetical protein
MVLQREFPVGGLDVVGRGALGYTEDVVVIALAVRRY